MNKVARSKTTYEGVGPAAVPGLMVQKPSPAVITAESAKKLAETLSKIVVATPDADVKETAAILAAMSTTAPTENGMDVEPTGGRRRKTKKRATKKRRVTRRRTMPTFSY